MVDKFSEYSLGELKHVGHQLLDEYISLDWRPQHHARKHAYDKLNLKLKRMYGTHHFGRMQNRKDVIEAIKALNKLIKGRKRKILFQQREKNIFLPLVEQKKLLRANNPSLPQ